ncbi:MAG: hypothetical protein IJJ26_01420 [Victivallales bacterium]|nr:hypothetical protein [Victivallales bacterium]
MTKNWLLLAPFALGSVLFGDVKLPSMFTDHAVLAKTAATPVFGWAERGESVEVKLGDASGKTTAGADGRWRVNLDLTKQGDGPFTLEVKGKNRLSVKDVVLGQVWLCSGQSNMAFQVSREQTAEEIRKQVPNGVIRRLRLSNVSADEPQTEPPKGTRWMLMDAKTVNGFSAVGYLFGLELQKSLGGYIGLIDNSWGGASLEAWLPKEDLEKAGNADLAKWVDKTSDAWFLYYEKAQEYLVPFQKWCKKTGRDKPAASQPPKDAEWKPFQIKPSGKIPGNGSVFLRQSFTVPQDGANRELELKFAAFGAKTTFFLDGETILRGEEKTAVALDPITIPLKKGQLTPGKHTLLLRLDSPCPDFATRGYGALPFVRDYFKGWEICRVDYPKLTKEQQAAMPKRFAPRPTDKHVPALLYNSLIHSLKPYAISGAIWYQGCSNADRPAQYAFGIQAMIRRWRTDFESDFPFYYCQLANFQSKKDNPNEYGWGAIRAGQEGALKLPKTGQAILIDCGEAGDIHPRDKVTPAKRLAAAVLHDVYGKDIPAHSPVFDSAKVENGQIRVKFKNVYGGLVAKELPATYNVETLKNRTEPLVRNSPKSEVEGFAVAGKDGKFVWADAKIVSKDTVVVKSDKVPNPVKIRYAYQSNPTCNLYNDAGFPAAPFNK